MKCTDDGNQQSRNDPVGYVYNQAIALLTAEVRRARFEDCLREAHLGQFVQRFTTPYAMMYWRLLL